mmetsp:Transcript_121882/g.242780  ORF Transcript_121882/g.242780 Transcript_121882/m.242780 type:complete len:201 (-) Transcript_121882:96-698(-)
MLLGHGGGLIVCKAGLRVHPFHIVDLLQIIIKSHAPCIHRLSERFCNGPLSPRRVHFGDELYLRDLILRFFVCQFSLLVVQPLCFKQGLIQLTLISGHAIVAEFTVVPIELLKLCCASIQCCPSSLQFTGVALWISIIHLQLQLLAGSKKLLARICTLLLQRYNRLACWRLCCLFVFLQLLGFITTASCHRHFCCWLRAP